MAKFKSPTGSPIIGTLELLRGRADINGIDPETGEPDHAGGTEIFWDDGRTATTPDGKRIFLDEAGDEWTFDRLTAVDGDGED